MIPQENTEATTRALTTAFAVDRYDDIRDLTERPGSNRAFRIVVKDRPYFLRINTRPGDVTRQFECMQAAAGAGLAPRVYYANVDDRLTITEFIESVPLPSGDALRLVPEALRRLHALPAFTVAPYNTTCTFLLTKTSMLDAFLQRFRTSNVLSEEDTSELLSRYAQVVDTYSTLESDPVSSHNDLFKPDNMLFDGSRLWFVDWEASFLNDRYADLAVVANMLASDEAAEKLFLQEYFGAPPAPYQSARLYLMQQLAHMFYAIAFLRTAGPTTSIDWNEPLPSYDEYQRRFWSGDIKLNDDGSRLDFGRIHWKRLLLLWSKPNFEEALRTVAARHRAAER